jgi:hypothetical protein
MRRRRWTFEEDQIIRSRRGKAAARQLPGRTAGAVGARRTRLGIGPSPNYWTKREDRRILKTAALPAKKAVKRFNNRSAAAILTRRQRFGCHIRKPNGAWNTSEMKLLEQNRRALENGAGLTVTGSVQPQRLDRAPAHTRLPQRPNAPCVHG